MSDIKLLLPREETPEWFTYPADFLRIYDQGLLDFNPWEILRGHALINYHLGLKQRYPDRDLVPFAKRWDCDDIACWEKDQGSTIVIVHDFASPGWERRKGFDSFWDWLRHALEETICFE